jgi:hypothetical protein
MRTGNTTLYEPARGKLSRRSQLLHNQYSQAVRHPNPYWPSQPGPSQRGPRFAAPCCRSFVSAGHRRKLVTDIIQEQRVMATCGKHRSTGQRRTGRARGGKQVASTRLELRQFRWAKGIQSTRLGLCFPLQLRRVGQISQRDKNKLFRSGAGDSSVFADAAEVDPERAQLAVEVGALHANALG